MENNTIFVGSKPVMNYVLAVVTQFNEGSSSVCIRARGKAISRAVDTAEIVRNRFVPDAVVKDIQISSTYFFQKGTSIIIYSKFLFHEPLLFLFLLL